MVDMTSRISYDTMRSALEGLGEEWWLGKCCVVVTRGNCLPIRLYVKLGVILTSYFLC